MRSLRAAFVLRKSVENDHSEIIMLLVVHGADLEVGIEAE